MLQRGVKDVECINLFDPHLGSKSGMGSEDRLKNEDGLQNEGGSQSESGFDTILLLMNGTGIAGKIENLPALFKRLKALLNKGGQILIDSSDIKYIYENEDGSFDINLNAAYYGEVDYQMVYKDVKGDSFDWLYVDFPLLKSIAESCGLHGELIAEGEHYDYLARFSNKTERLKHILPQISQIYTDLFETSSQICDICGTFRAYRVDLLTHHVLLNRRNRDIRKSFI